MTFVSSPIFSKRDLLFFTKLIFFVLGLIQGHVHLPLEESDEEEEADLNSKSLATGSKTLSFKIQNWQFF